MKPRSSILVVVALFLVLGPAAAGSAATRPAAGGSPIAAFARRGSRGNSKLTADAVAHSKATSGPLANIAPVDQSGVDSKGRRDVVVSGPDPAKLADTVRAHGGEVLTTAPGAVRAQVPAG